MSMKQQWQIELQNAFCFKTFLAHDIYHYHHIDTVIMISILSSSLQKNTDNYKTALSSEHHLSPTLAWLSVKFLWAFSLRVTFNVHNLNGLMPWWVLSFQKLFAIRHWLNDLFSNPMNTFNLFLDLYQPVWTIDDRRSQKNYNHKKWHYQIMVILSTVRQKNHESDLEDSLCGLVDVEHIRSWRVELLDIERQREFWSRGSRYI